MKLSLVNMIRNGDAYVNVHTTQNQNREVRGQIYTAYTTSDIIPYFAKSAKHLHDFLN
jgi:hypothetical protein